MFDEWLSAVLTALFSVGIAATVITLGVYYSPERRQKRRQRKRRLREGRRPMIELIPAKAEEGAEKTALTSDAKS